LRELEARLKCIDTRLHNNFARDAAFHGVKIPFKYNTESQEIEFTPEEDAFLSAKLKEAQERKRQEMKARNG